MTQSSGAAVLRIGTRGSPLARWQAQEVRARLAAAHGLDAETIEVKAFRTSGDRIQDRTLAEAGGKGLFTKEIEDALLAGVVDLAVHSAKDMPTFLPPGLVIAAYLTREDVRDVFLSRMAARPHDLAPGAIVGTASLRRQAQMLRLRPDGTDAREIERIGPIADAVALSRDAGMELKRHLPPDFFGAA
jgi:hydroxymethylbilane synthase